MCLTWLVLVICTTIAFIRHEIFFEQDPLPSRYVFISLSCTDHEDLRLYMNALATIWDNPS
jgi:hypothetical protein